jgi:filamentous hemagglutinin family protein
VANKRSFQRRLIQAAVASCFATAAHANPTGPSVVSGAATFNAVGKNLTITNSPGAIINWQGFSIRADEVTRFVQSGAASAVLNRVTGTGHSQLLGQLLSNGRVFLINPNGVTVGAGARIDTAGFVASSLALSNEDFLAGKFRFTDPGNAGSVVNAGTINAHSGGPVYLVAPTVENHGVITSPGGDVMLAAGKSVELVSAASPHLRVQVQAGGEALNVGRLVAESGRVGLYGAAVRNSGLVSADSAQVTAAGTVVLKASKDVTLDATSAVTANGAQGGSITAQAETGTLLADGRIEARGSEARGGEVQLLGTRVGVLGAASVDASGAGGGGTVLVGGDYLGGSADIQNARRTVVAPGAKIAADATAGGDGGRVIVWSDEYTGFHGAISARGGAAGGNGGFVETSSKDNLQAFGTVDAAAPAGRAGEWLLDPRNVTIANAASSNGAFGGGSPNVFTPVGDDAVADRNTIQTSLNAGTSVTVTTGATGTQAGDIVVQDAVTKTTTTGAPTLTLNAAGGIAVNSAISGSAAGRVLNVNLSAGAGITFGAGGSIVSRNGAVTMAAGGAAALGTVNAGSGALSVTTSGPITQNAGTALTTTGATTLAAGAANDITLANATNSLANVRITSGNNVSIRDNTAFSFGGGASSVSGNLTVDSNGNVTQVAGATVTVGGTTAINTRGANRDVTLNLANDFGGAVSVVPAANTTRNVNLRDANALTLGTVTATGTLAAVAAGAITDAGNLTITGTTTLTAGAANDITLDNANDFGGQVRIVSARDVTLNDVNAFVFGAGGISAVSRNLSVTAGGAVTQAATALTVAGTTAINAGGASVTLTTTTNNFGGAVSVTGNGVSLRDTNAIVLGTVNAAGNLAVTSNGAMTDTGNLTVAGTTTLTAGTANNITLNNANDFGGQVRIVSARDATLNDVNAFAFGAGGTSAVSRNLSVTAGGAVTQAATALTVTGTTAINAGGANVTLTTAANNFGGAVSVTGNGVSLRDTNAIVLGTVNAAGNLAVTSNGAMTDTGNLTVAGTTTLTAGTANNITLNNANDFGGQVRIVSARDVTLNDVNAFAFGAGGTSAVSRNLNLTAAGPVTQANPLTVTRASTLAAGAANDITLTNATNSFGNVRITSGNNVSIRDNTALAFGGGASTVSGTLTVDSNGSVTQAAGSTLSAGGGMTVNTRGANANVTLNLANDVAGAVTIAPAAGTIRDVNYRNVNTAAQTPATPASFRNFTLTLNNAPVDLAATTLSGSLNVTAGGAITDAGVLAVTGTTTLAAGAANNITLDNANNFVGNVRVVSGNDVTLNDTNALVLGGGVSTVSGNLALTTAGAVTQASGLTVNGTTSISAGTANDVTLANAANNFGGAVSVAANDISLGDANALALGTVTATTNGGDIGSLTLQAAGSVTQTGVVTTPALTAALTGGASALNLGTQPNAIAVLNAVTAPGGVTLTNGNAALAVNGNVTATNAPVSISTGTAGYTQGTNRDVSAGSGPITITADSIAIAGNTGNNAFATSGTLTLKPATAGQAMSLAGAAPFDLTQAELTAFASGASGPIVIGDAAASTGTMTIGGTANLAGETLTLNAGSITDGANPGRTITAANLNLNARTGAIGSAAANGAIDVAVTNLTVTTASQNAYVNATGAVNLGAGPSNLGAGGLNLTSSGAITQSGAVTATGSSTFAAGAANNVALTNAANDFGTVAVTSGNAVSLVDANALALGASGVTSLQAQTLGGDLTLNGAVTASGGGNSIVLASSANFVNNAGAGALVVPVGGRWVVYSANPAANAFSGLASGNQAVWGASFAGLPPTSPSMPGGNRYVSTTQPTVTLTSTDAAKVYGDLGDVSTNYTATGFVDAAASGNVFTQDTVGNSFAPFSVTSAGTPVNANAGVYPIVIAATPTTGYAVTISNAGQLTVNGRPITVQADNQARAYGDPNPTTGPYTITAGSLAGTDSITNVNVTSPATVLSGVGPYALTPTAANFGTGTAANYTITFADGVLTVTPRPLTATANNQAKVYGQPDPALTFTAPTVNGDVLAGTPVRAPGETVAGSPYAITQGTVTNANNPNYSITFVNGQLVITAANLTITADSKTRPYGDANPPLTATFTGLANGDTAAAIPGVTLTTPAVPASNVGNYVINVASGANTNYTITYVNGQLAITPAPLTIAADDKARAFGAPNPPFTATATGLKLGQTVGDLSGTLAFTTPATTTSPPGAYTITPGGVSSGSYTITFVDGVLVVGQGAPPSDQALVTAVGRSESDPDGLRGDAAEARTTDCLSIERPGARRVLGRCF